MLDEFNDKRAQIIEGLGKLSAVAIEVGSPTVGKRIDGQLIDKLANNRFHLVVVGEFNHGKTTFVNALLGQNILPVGVTPTTAVIHEIDYGEEPRATALYESGEEREMPFEAVRQFALGNSAPDPDPGPVRALRVRFPAELLREHISLVDTPGVNDLSLARADITYKYIPQSDAVLFLLDAGQLVKESERIFLQEKLLGQSRDKIVFVVTKKDILEPDEVTTAMHYVDEQLSKLVTRPQVFAISAEEALDGRRDQSGMNELLDYLTRFLATERGKILLDNALGESLAACTTVGKGIDAKRRGLEMSVEEISRRIAAIEKDLAGQAKTMADRRSGIREEVSAIKAWVQRDLQHFVDDACGQIPGVVDNAKVEDLKAHLGPFLEKAFRDWANAETHEIANALEKLAEKTVALVRDDAREAGRRVATALGADLRAPAIEVDTFAYDVGVAALATVGLGVLFANWMVGSVLVIAAPILAIYMRDRVELETRNKAKELAPKALRDAAAKVGPKLDEMIDDFATRLDAWVVSATEEVYREVIEVLTSARRERERGEAARALAVSLCAEHDHRLEELQQTFEQLRVNLFADPVAEAAPTESMGGAPAPVH